MPPRSPSSARSRPTSSRGRAPAVVSWSASAVVESGRCTPFREVPGGRAPHAGIDPGGRCRVPAGEADQAGECGRGDFERHGRGHGRPFAAVESFAERWPTAYELPLRRVKRYKLGTIPSDANRRANQRATHERPMTDTLILQLSDLHLFADPAERLFGIPTRELLQDVLAHVEASGIRPDHVIVTGDHTHDELPQSYEAARGLLRPLARPALAPPGQSRRPGCAPLHLRRADRWRGR